MRNVFLLPVGQLTAERGGPEAASLVFRGTCATRVRVVSRFPAAVNEQIGHEFAASQQYVAIAVYYDAETLPQLAAHFYRQAVEERNHAMMLVQYLLDAGEDVAVPGVAEPQTSFSNAAEPVELALAQEKTVTQQIAGLVELARQENDLVGEQGAPEADAPAAAGGAL